MLKVEKINETMCVIHCDMGEALELKEYFSSLNER